MENKNIIIISVCTIILFLSLIISCSKGCSSDSYEQRIVTSEPTNNNKKLIEDEKKDESRDDYIPSGDSSYSYSDSYEGSDGTPPGLLTEEDKEELAKNYDEDYKAIIELKKEWVEKELKDPNNTPVAIEQLKLRSNPSFLKGMVAFENNDFDKAIVSFNEMLKDDKATPVTKYFACLKLMDVAMKKKDKDLYFIAARTRADLIAKEDLSVIDIKQDKDAVDWVNLVEYSLKAKDEQKYFDFCLEMKLRKAGIDIDSSTYEIKEKAAKEVEEDIKFYRNIYKELIE